MRKTPKLSLRLACSYFEKEALVQSNLEGLLIHFKGPTKEEPYLQVLMLINNKAVF